MKTLVALGASMLFASSVSLVAGTYNLTPQYQSTDLSIDGVSHTGHPLRVGDIVGGTNGRSAILVFAMPKIPLGEVVTGAAFAFSVADIPGAATFNGDLYSLPVSTTGAASGTADYYQGAFGGFSLATPIQNDILTPSTLVGSVSASATGNYALAEDFQNKLDDGYTQGSYYLLSLNPDFAASTDLNLGWDVGASQDPNPPSLTITTGEPLQLGRVLIEYWTGITGAAVSALTSSPNYPNKPSSREYSTVMEIPQNMDINSGDRLRGFFYVPTTGSYTFAIAANDSANLLFSTDNDPAHAVQIAFVSGPVGYQSWKTQTTQVSSSIPLVAGQVCYIESRHKQATLNSNMSIGMKGPADSSISLMKTDCVAPYDAGAAYTANAIASLVQPFAHPRLMISPAAIKRIAEEVTPGTPQYNAKQASAWGYISNVCTGKNATDLMPMGDAELKGPIISPNNVALAATPPAAGPLLNNARDLQNRIYVLSLFYLVESQLSPTNSNLPKALNQIYIELQAAQSWGQSGTATGVWDVNNQLDLAEMVHAYAIAYDWCYGGWTPAQRAFLVNTISKHGLAEDDGGDGNTNGKGNELAAWPFTGTVEGNWGLICNGGALIGALAILGDETTGTNGTLTSPNTAQAPTVLNTIMPALPNTYSMKGFGGDGGWTEGPGYWGESAKYLTLMFASLETSSATCFTLDKLSGISSTDSFLTYDTGFALAGGQPMTFNFSDSEAANYDLPAQQYLGLKYNEPLYSYPENTLGHYPTDVLWFDPRVQAPNPTAPLSTYYNNSGVIFLRTAWGDPNALFAGIKSGYNANVTPYGSSHEMLQIGTFVFDALGVRWAESLGADLSHYGSAYFNTNPYAAANRWQYYRCRAEGSNTLVINPALDGGQYSYANAAITNFKSTPAGTASSLQQVIIDMTSGYSKVETPSAGAATATTVTSAKRGFRILNGTMQVQDEITTTSAQPLYWFMHTATSVSVSGNTATLTDASGSNHLLMTIQSPVTGASFQALAAAPLPSSPNPSQSANTGVVRLGINLMTASAATTTLTVSMAPYTSGAAPSPPAVVPLSSW